MEKVLSGQFGQRSSPSIDCGRIEEGKAIHTKAQIRLESSTVRAFTKSIRALTDLKIRGRIALRVSAQELEELQNSFHCFTLSVAQNIQNVLGINSDTSTRIDSQMLWTRTFQEIGRIRTQLNQLFSPKEEAPDSIISTEQTVNLVSALEKTLAYLALFDPENRTWPNENRTLSFIREEETKRLYTELEECLRTISGEIMAISEAMDPLLDERKVIPVQLWVRLQGLLHDIVVDVVGVLDRLQEQTGVSTDVADSIQRNIRALEFIYFGLDGIREEEKSSQVGDMSRLLRYMKLNYPRIQEFFQTLKNILHSEMIHLLSEQE